MQLIEIEKQLSKLKLPIIQTNDVSAYFKIPHAQASNIMSRLERAGRVVRLMRGKWVLSEESDPLIMAEYLTSPFPSYISLQTALFYHGMISQIAHTTYVVSLARAKIYKTPLGNFSVHHIQPDFFFGFESKGQIKIATPEKALIDVLYLSPASSRLFKTLPELELPKTFSIKKAKAIIAKIPSPRTKGLVQERFEKIIGKIS